MKTQSNQQISVDSNTKYPFLFALPLQLVFIGSVVLADLAISGRVGPIIPALALFVGGYFGFRRLESHNGLILDYSLIRRASVVSGIGLWF